MIIPGELFSLVGASSNKMAEDTSLRNICEPSMSVSNEHETSALFLLQSIAEEWRTNQSVYDSPGDLMRNCLSRAGVSLLGEEALQIHMALFRDVFIENKSGLSCAVMGLGFSLRDYFELLRDEKLGWLSFLIKILPYLRLEKANNFLEKLEEFVRSIEETFSTLTDVQLLLCAVSLIHSIILDFLLTEKRDGNIQDEIVHSSTLDKSSVMYRQLCSDSQTLALHLKTCLASLLRLCRVDKLLVLIMNNNIIFRQLIESLVVSVTILNPYSTMESTARLLQNSYLGRVVIPDIHRRSQGVEKKERREQKSDVGDRDHPNDNIAAWTEIVLEIQHDKTKAAEHNKVVEVGDTSNFDQKCCVVNAFINDFLSSTPPTLFVDLVYWFSPGDMKTNRDFYQSLADVLFEYRNIYVGHHVLSGHSLYSWLMTFLQELAQGGLHVVLKKSVEDPSELEAVVTEHLLPYKDCDLSYFNKTEVDFILESGRCLAGQDDLNLVRRSVKDKSSGCRDLLELGLGNTDINGWWRAGFFQLVLDNESNLSKETNVRKMLTILCQAAVGCQSHEDMKFCQQVHRLFDIMFQRLPILLQEHVVLSTLVPSSDSRPCLGHASDLLRLRTDGLQHLLSKEKVIEQMTTLLNKLTSASVHKMMGYILSLCLFAADVVIQKALQVALENKAQIQPVVEVLRQMPHICSYAEAKSSQSKLLFCLHEILSATLMSDKKADNLVQLLCLLTETYSLEIDVDNGTHNITKNISGLLSQSDIFHHFIRPSLDTGDYSAVNVSLKPESSDQTARIEDTLQNEDIYRQAKHEEYRQGYDPATDNAGIQISDSTSGIECEVVFQLPLDVALRTLSALLGKVDKLDILALKPFPLLAMLADLYTSNYMMLNADQLDKSKQLIRQASQANITLLTAAVWKHVAVFTNADFLWLKEFAIKCGWLSTAVLKPVLNIGCDVQLHDVLNSFASQLMLEKTHGNNIKGLVVLIQLALVNDEMLSDVMSVLKQSQLSTGHTQLVLAVGCILASALTTEMYRLVNIIKMLISNQDEPFHIDIRLLVPTAGTDICLHVQVSQLLALAVLQLSTSEMEAGLWFHIVSNYQSSIQALLLHQESPNLCLLVDVLCHCCMVLSITDGQTSQLLQVSAMDILTKLKMSMSSAVVGQSDMTRIEGEQRQLAVSVVEDYLCCVHETSVQQTLIAQLATVL